MSVLATAGNFTSHWNSTSANVTVFLKDPHHHKIQYEMWQFSVVVFLNAIFWIGTGPSQTTRLAFIRRICVEMFLPS